MLTCMNGHREIERLNNQPVPNLFIESVYFSVTVLSDTAVLSKFPCYKSESCVTIRFDKTL